VDFFAYFTLIIYLFLCPPDSHNRYDYAIVLVFSGQFGKNRLIIHWHKQGQRNRVQIETAGVGSSLCSAFSGFRHIHKAFDLDDAFLSVAPNMNIALDVSGRKLRAESLFVFLKNK
jgi:hypothetical protein